MFVEELLIGSKMWKQSKWSSTDEHLYMCTYIYMSVHTHTHTHGILLSHKKGWNNAICNSMNEPIDYHVTRGKSKIKISYNITYMWNLKKWYKWTYLYDRNRLTDIENKLMLIKGDMGG